MGGACSSADPDRGSAKHRRGLGLLTVIMGRAGVHSIHWENTHHRTVLDEEVLASHRSGKGSPHRRSSQNGPDARLAAALLQQEIAGRSFVPRKDTKQEPEPGSGDDGESEEEEQGRGKEENFDSASRSPRQPSARGSRRNSEHCSPDKTPRKSHRSRRRHEKESTDLAKKFEQAVQQRHREIEQHRQDQEEAHRAQAQSQRRSFDDWGGADEPHGDPSPELTPRSLRPTRSTDLEQTRSGNLSTLSSAPPSRVRSVSQDDAIGSGNVQDQIKSMSTEELNALDSRVGGYSQVHRAYRSRDVSRATSRDTSRATSPLAQTRSGQLSSHPSRSLSRNYSPRKAHDSLSRAQSKNSLGDESARSRGHTREGRLKS